MATTPYRTDHDALMARLVSLLDELEGLRARARDLQDVDGETKRVEREIAGLREKIERVAPTRLPLLDRVSVASPCSADWSAMTGDERSRRCAQCDKQVYNVSGMGAEEAEELLRTRVAEACVRLYRRADGTVLTADCPVGVRRRRSRRRVIAAVAGGGLAMSAALFGSQRQPPPVAPIMPSPVAATPAVDPTAPVLTAMPADTAVPQPPRHAAPPRHLAGGAPRLSPHARVEAEMANVRRLLEKHAKMTSPAELRSVENELRASRERIANLEKDSAY